MFELLLLEVKSSMSATLTSAGLMSSALRRSRGTAANRSLILFCFHVLLRSASFLY